MLVFKEINLQSKVKESICTKISQYVTGRSRCQPVVRRVKQDRGSQTRNKGFLSVRRSLRRRQTGKR